MRMYLPGLPQPPRALVMGILNVTPDSFSDGGQFDAPDRALAHAQDLISAGADIIDIGGESTRPGAARVPVETELQRVIPLVSQLSSQVAVSVDTMRAEVAAAAIDAGAVLINDVSGGLADPKMAQLLANRPTPYVCMHWRAHSATMQAADLTRYDDVVADVISELQVRVSELVASGVHQDLIALDPGIGFSKTAEHNWELLAAMGRFTTLGFPVLFGASRKGFLGSLLADAQGEPRPAQQRDAASSAVATLAALAGAWAIRTHNVADTCDAVRVAAAVEQAAEIN